MKSLAHKLAFFSQISSKEWIEWDFQMADQREIKQVFFVTYKRIVLLKLWGVALLRSYIVATPIDKKVYSLWYFETFEW